MEESGRDNMSTYREVIDEVNPNINQMARIVNDQGQIISSLVEQGRTTADDLRYLTGLVEKQQETAQQQSQFTQATLDKVYGQNETLLNTFLSFTTQMQATKQANKHEFRMFSTGKIIAIGSAIFGVGGIGSWLIKELVLAWLRK